MRLLNTITFDLKEFLGENIPEYAILSHTWGENEVVFQDFKNGQDAWKEKPSFKKLSGFCSIANESGYEWCWIDTCCIDKSSSAELSEAINSMFDWYDRSHVCFAYLVDVQIDYADPENLQSFEGSRWFTRGWTLQEMLSPARVEFYDVNWNQFGTKFALCTNISRAAGIREVILTEKFDKKFSHRIYSVAERMSWAANRNTTRVEDLAYCLLGIFNVNMPLLYGEGSRAFERLQFQILAETEDLTLFASRGPPGDLLAESPSDFRESTSRDQAASQNWTYQLLDVGPYGRVWDDLEAVCTDPHTTNKIKSKTTGHEPPVRRLETIILDMAFLPKAQGHGDLAVLCKLDPTKWPPISPPYEYLCLPVALHSQSSSFHKVGMATRVNLKDRPGDIHYKRVSILLKSRDFGHREGYQPLSPTIVLSVQGEGKGLKRVYLHRSQSSTAVLLRHQSTEFIVLHGTEMSLCGGWIVLTTWEELPTVRDRVPLRNMNPGDFAQIQLVGGVRAFCTLKPRIKRWYLSLKGFVSLTDAEFQHSAGSDGFFSVSVSVKSSEGRLERIEYLGLRIFINHGELQDWFDDPNPRRGLLEHRRWR
jgi:hypothetical protein